MQGQNIFTSVPLWLTYVQKTTCSALTDWIQYICRTMTTVQHTQHNHRVSAILACSAKKCKKPVKVTDLVNVNTLVHYSEWFVGLIKFRGQHENWAILIVMISWWLFDGSMRRARMGMRLPCSGASLQPPSSTALWQAVWCPYTPE